MALLPLNKQILSLLIDPDKVDVKEIEKLCKKAEYCGFDLFLVGGSLVYNETDELIKKIKLYSSLPVYIFPGNAIQLSNSADGILFLSLVSGRNPEYLIGQQVIAAPLLKKTNLDVVSVAYMLIESGSVTSVEYMSNTKPIPAEKTDIIVATAIASEYLGYKMIYLEAGSGAKNPISNDIITKVVQNVNIPVIVGGGIRDVTTAQQCINAG
ncbi:MAG: geranylgeranylglyceryl/heptaprenylglyceryl phosphate synthase, partial [Bacteroidales bacterium]|nr:geranylgeranylglyceryl/heptaprenylglyceryl phosphate synthase [Bacteroidales bacterium]